MFYVLVAWIEPLPSDLGRLFLVSSLMLPTLSIIQRSPKTHTTPHFHLMRWVALPRSPLSDVSC